MEDKELISTITTGFERIAAQMEGRDARLTRVEMTQESLVGRVERIENHIQEGENASNKVKIENQEARITELTKKVEGNDAWIRGLLVLVIFSLFGVLSQFIIKGK